MLTRDKNDLNHHHASLNNDSFIHCVIYWLANINNGANLQLPLERQKLAGISSPDAPPATLPLDSRWGLRLQTHGIRTLCSSKLILKKPCRKIRPWLLWNANRKPYKSFGTIQLSMTLNDPNPEFDVTPLFDAEALRNGKRNGYNEIGTYTRPTQGYHFEWLNDLEWPCVI